VLARVLSAGVNGIEAFPIVVEVNSGWGDTVVVLIMSILPTTLADTISARAARTDQMEVALQRRSHG
jgi:hypothetical protein